MFFLSGSAFLILLILTSNNILELPHTTQVTYAKTITPKAAIKPRTARLPQFPSNTPIPTLKPSISPTITPKPTAKSTVISVSKSPSLTPANTTAPTNNIGLMLMEQINDFRAGKGLAPLSTEGFTCSFAVARAGEIVGSFNHDGFRSRIDSKTLPYPSYSSVAENIAMNSDPNSVVPGWINSPGHNENMSKDVPYGCVGMSGNYFAFEAWKP